MRTRLDATVVAAVVAATAAVACSASSKTPNGEQAGGQRTVTLFVTTEIKGQIEPCGCTADQLGDIARIAGALAAARAADPAVVYLDGGSLLYREPTGKPARAAQDQLTAELMAGAMTDALRPAAVGLGPYDLALGPARVAPPRQVANLAADAGVAVEAPRVIDAGGVRVGVFGVVDPALIAPLGVTATDPIAAARAAVAELRAQQARVVVGLLHMDRKAARALAREVEGIDFAVIGAAAPEPDELSPKPSQANGAWLVQPANRGQVVTRLDLTIDGPGGFTDAIGEARAAAEIAAIDERLARLRTDIAAYEADPRSDGEFVARQQADLLALQRERDDLERSPLRKPERGSWFTASQLAMRKSLACDAEVQRRKRAFDQAAGRANLAAAPAQPTAPVDGQAAYAGVAACADCHAEQVAFWRKTRHASAWETLVDVGKQYDLDCVLCHSTGFDAPGGATLATLAHAGDDGGLVDVQCEVCHLAASLHVQQDGGEQPSTLRLQAPRDMCVSCHNPLHSDIFDYDAYLRDVTGPGHGAELRARLGDGPTGHQLRAAAKAKAGTVIGEGCLK